MPYKINPKGIQSISALSPTDRYMHFLSRVADWEEVWGLHSDAGWAMSSDGEGGECVPFWPHPEYAKAMTVGHWSGREPTSVPLADFLEKWLPGMAKDGLRVAVFPTPENAKLVDPMLLKQDLESECKQYE
jgi:hypothetical protein